MGGELAAGVLGDVGELVAQQAISGFGTGCELVTGEVDVMPDGEAWAPISSAASAAASSVWTRT